MASKIDNLAAEVALSVTVQESAIVLINGIATRIKEAGVDPEALKTLEDELRSTRDALSAAIVTNTPSA